MTHKSHAPLARAIDLGHGYVKLSRAMITAEYGLATAAFPSFAPLADGLVDFGDSTMRRLDVIPVTADGVRFLAGPDALLAASGRAVRATGELFFTSPQYLALYIAAIAHMDIPDGASIHVLGMGLPLTVWRDTALRAQLKQRLTGVFSVPVPGTAANRQISVERVQIWPQVVGSLVSTAAENGILDTVAQQNNLVVDVGFGTLLWMSTNGLKPQTARSGGNNGGAATMVKAVAKMIDPGLAGDPRILEAIDVALRTGAPLSVGGASIDLAQCRKVIAAQAMGHLQELAEHVGNHQDFNNIFLTGGGAHYYAELLQRHFKGRSIRIPQSEPRFSNLLGFQHLAEQVLANIGA